VSRLSARERGEIDVVGFCDVLQQIQCQKTHPVTVHSVTAIAAAIAAAVAAAWVQ